MTIPLTLVAFISGIIITRSFLALEMSLTFLKSELSLDYFLLILVFRKKK